MKAQFEGMLALAAGWVEGVVHGVGNKEFSSKKKQHNEHKISKFDSLILWTGCTILVKQKQCAFFATE